MIGGLSVGFDCRAWGEWEKRFTPEFICYLLWVEDILLSNWGGSLSVAKRIHLLFELFRVSASCSQ